VNKRPVVPVFIMLMLLNNYPEPEISDGLCMEEKNSARLRLKVVSAL
jgi:hypothetical protein